MTTQTERVSDERLLPNLASTSEKALNCPFCEADADEWVSVEVGVRPGAMWFVECNRCCCSGPYAATRGKAIEAWNRRASPAPAESGEPYRAKLATMLAEMLDLNDDDLAQPITSDILVNPYESADYILAALAHPPAESAGSTSTSGGVKPLEWVKHPSAELWRADSLIGRHQVYAVISQIDWAYDGWDGTRTSGDASSIEAAKATCQADYEARIRSALSASPTNGVGVTKRSQIDALVARATAAEARVAQLETALKEAQALNNKYAWERDKAREERDSAERRSEAFWKPIPRQGE